MKPATEFSVAGRCWTSGRLFGLYAGE